MFTTLCFASASYLLLTGNVALGLLALSVAVSLTLLAGDDEDGDEE